MFYLIKIKQDNITVINTNGVYKNKNDANQLQEK